MLSTDEIKRLFETIAENESKDGTGSEEIYNLGMLRALSLVLDDDYYGDLYNQEAERWKNNYGSYFYNLQP